MCILTKCDYSTILASRVHVAAEKLDIGIVKREVAAIFIQFCSKRETGDASHH